MKIEKDAVVEKLKERIKEWDANFERFEFKSYPMRLMAQVQHRAKIKALISTRELVEKKMLNINRWMNPIR